MADKTVSIKTQFVDAFNAPLKQATTALQSFGAIGVRVARSLIAPLTQVTKLFGVLGLVVGGFSFAGFINGVRRSIESMSEMARQAENVGVSAAFLGNLSLAAERIGVRSVAMQKAIQSAKEALDDFRRTGGGPAASALARLDLRFKNADGSARSFEEILPEISAGLSRIRSEQRRLETFEAIFGSRNPRLVGLLGSPQQLAEVQQDLKAIGASFSDRQIEIVERFNRALEVLAETIRGLQRRVAEAIAPIATDLTVRLAAAVATIPDVIRELSSLIADAFNPDGAIATAARAKIDRLVESLFNAAATVVVESVRLVAVSLYTAVDNALTVLAPTLIPRVALFVADVASQGVIQGMEAVEKTLRATLDRIIALPGFNGLKGGLLIAAEALDEFSQFSDQFRKAGRTILETFLEIPSASEIADQITGGFSGAADVWTESFQRIGDASRGFFDELNASTGLVDAFRARIDAVLKAIAPRQSIEIQPPDPGPWKQFFAAVSRGFENVAEKARQIGELGDDIGRSLARGVRDFSSAIVDGIQGVKSFGDAFKQVASNILRQISEMIIQFLIFRAISGIVGGAFGGGGGVGPGTAVPSDIPAGGIGNLGGVAFAARGALVLGGVAAASVPAFANGGIIPAFPGGQLFRAGEAGDPEAVLPLTRTRGGDLGVRADMGAFGGASGDVHITINVSMHGAARHDAEAQRQGSIIGKEAASQLLGVLERSPALRQRLHALPGAKK